MVEGDEACDGQALGGVDCVALGFGPGMPSCTDACEIDSSGCPAEGEGEGCTPVIDPCPNDLACVDSKCYDGSEGDPCDWDSDCQDGLSCPDWGGTCQS